MFDNFRREMIAVVFAVVVVLGITSAPAEASAILPSLVQTVQYYGPGPGYYRGPPRGYYSRPYYARPYYGPRYGFYGPGRGFYGHPYYRRSFYR